MSDAAADQRDVPRGSTLLPRDLTEDELVGAPVLPSTDVLVIEDLTNDEDEAFAPALRSGDSLSTPASRRLATWASWRGDL